MSTNFSKQFLKMLEHTTCLDCKKPLMTMKHTRYASRVVGKNICNDCFKKREKEKP
jgi:hypothetical protein